MPAPDTGGAAGRLLFIHAHPDDETLATGVALAAHVAAGSDVHVLTCTLGEEGEVIPPHLAHLAPGRSDRRTPMPRSPTTRSMPTDGERPTAPSPGCATSSRPSTPRHL